VREVAGDPWATDVASGIAGIDERSTALAPLPASDTSWLLTVVDAELMPVPIQFPPPGFDDLSIDEKIDYLKL
jgi:hypothetical protein